MITYVENDIFKNYTEELYSYEKIRSILSWNAGETSWFFEKDIIPTVSIISNVEYKHLVVVNPDLTTTKSLKGIRTMLPPIKLIEKIIAGLNLRESNTKEPNLVQDSGVIAKIDTNRDKFFYGIDYLDDDLYENSEPTNRKGGPTLSYYDFIHYDIGDRYFDIDDGDLYNFDIFGHFTFKIVSHATINMNESTLSFYRINEIRNLSNLSKTEKLKDDFIEENF